MHVVVEIRTSGVDGEGMKSRGSVIRYNQRPRMLGRIS
jgi:hypothetical protein